MCAYSFQFFNILEAFPLLIDEELVVHTHRHIDRCSEGIEGIFYHWHIVAGTHNLF